jgi:hypothetical protein
VSEANARQSAVFQKRLWKYHARYTITVRSEGYNEDCRHFPSISREEYKVQQLSIGNKVWGGGGEST